ncbi:hypothetical protein Tco_0711205 [Tanacetum coccineum]
MRLFLQQFQATPPPASVKKPLRRFVLLAVVLILIISVSPPMATLSRNIGIIFKDSAAARFALRSELQEMSLFRLGKFTFPADFVIVDYESDPRVPLYTWKSLLRTDPCSLIEFTEKKMLLRDDKRRTNLGI